MDMAEITVIIKDNTGTELWSFVAEDRKNFQELAAMHGIDIPLSCGGGVCGICMCSVEQGAEFVDEAKTSTPIMPMQRDEEGNPTEVLSCIAGVKTETFKDPLSHTIILQKTY